MVPTVPQSASAQECTKCQLLLGPEGSSGTGALRHYLTDASCKTQCPQGSLARGGMDLKARCFTACGATNSRRSLVSVWLAARRIARHARRQRRVRRARTNITFTMGNAFSPLLSSLGQERLL